MADPQGRAARRDYIDVLKGLGIILVVFGHFIEQYRLVCAPISAAFLCIYLFHMALFCMCSGLVARFSLRKLILQQLWLYLLGQALMLAFRSVVLREDFTESGGTLMALLLPWRHMWYLYALLFWHLTLPVLCLLRDKLRLPGAVLGFAAALWIGLKAGTVDWPFTLVRVFAFYPFYAFGVLFRPQIDALARTAARLWALRLALCVPLLVFYGSVFRGVLRGTISMNLSAPIFQDSTYNDGYTMKDRAMFYLIGLLTSLALAAIAGKGFRGLASLGKRTLSIYILHMPIFAFLMEAGFYETVREGSDAVRIAWVTLQSLGCLCLLASGPVSGAFTFISNLWYKPPFLRRKATEKAEKA